MKTNEALEQERDRLKGELSRVRAQLMALESVLATSEHLVLKAPAFHVWDFHNLHVPSWGVAPMRERWFVDLSIEREALTGIYAGHRDRVVVSQHFARVDVFEPPRVLFACLPPPRRI